MTDEKERGKKKKRRWDMCEEASIFGARRMSEDMGEEMMVGKFNKQELMMEEGEDLPQQGKIESSGGGEELTREHLFLLFEDSD